MDEILWIRAVDYDPSVRVGTRIRPDQSLPFLEVVEHRPVVMMFHSAQGWEVRPFTQLKLGIVGPHEHAPEIRFCEGKL